MFSSYLDRIHLRTFAVMTRMSAFSLKPAVPTTGLSTTPPYQLLYDRENR